MTILDRPQVRTAAIDFHPLSDTEWRITDSRLPQDSIEALLGFVGLHQGAFFVTRMNHPLESTPFASLDAVAAFLRQDHAGSR